MDTGPLMVESKKSKVHLGIELHQEKEKVFWRNNDNENRWRQVRIIYMRLWWWWKRKRRRDYDDSSSACLNCWLLNFVLVRISRCSSLVVVLVVDRWWWWCWRRRFFSSLSVSIICAVGLRLLLWFVVWKTERDKDSAKKKGERKKELSKEGKESVYVVIPQRIIVKERARWASFLLHSIIPIQNREHLSSFSFFSLPSPAKEKEI